MITLALLLLSILFIIIASTRFKWHPFLALVAAAFLFGAFSGMPLLQVIETINSGFGSTLGSIGLLIIAGILIGTFLENSGGAQVLAKSILSITGKKRVYTALASMGYLVSIPVYADSGFIILHPLGKALAEQAKKNKVGVAIALALGLTASHTMVPPTPGPIAAAGILEANLGLVIPIGLGTSLVALVACMLFSKYVGKQNIPVKALEAGPSKSEQTWTHPPKKLKAFLPIVVPIILIVLSAIAKFPTAPFGEGELVSALNFIGHPVTALIIGVFLSLTLPRKLDRQMLSTSGWVGEALKKAAIIILITGAGGAFGKVLQASDLSAVIGENLQSLQLGILLPFLVAAAIKTAQGSSTVALITTASIVAPLLGTLGLDSEISKALVVIAIGAGSAVVSHANDSFFWIVTQMTGLNIQQGYRTHSLGTAILGFTALLVLLLLHIIFT